MIVVTPVSENRIVLAAALLPQAKQQLRIDWTYDDPFIQDAIARAIGKLQAVNGVLINPSSYKWTPEAVEFYCETTSTEPLARIPYTPASSFTASDGTTDISADYSIINGALTGARPQYLVGSHVEGLEITIVAGHAALVDVPDNLRDKILRVTAHLYEHREILIPNREFLAPDFGLDATDWMPAV